MKLLYLGVAWMRIGIKTSPCLLKPLTGVYLIKFMAEGKPVIYIGSTKNLGRRLRSHQLVSKIKKHPILSDCVEILFSERTTLKLARSLESKLIENAKPKMNIYGTISRLKSNRKELLRFDRNNVFNQLLGTEITMS